jgi:hypothetical protein
MFLCRWDASCGMGFAKNKEELDKSKHIGYSNVKSQAVL